MPIKKPSVTYAELYVRDLLIERDSAGFYRNLITQLDAAQFRDASQFLREWAKLDETADASADGWLPSCDEAIASDAPTSTAQRLSFWMALSIALAAESKAKLYYEGALKRTVDPSAQALAEKRVGERLQRMEHLRGLIKDLQPTVDGADDANGEPSQPAVPAWVQARIASYGNIRFVHSEPA